MIKMTRLFYLAQSSKNSFYRMTKSFRNTGGGGDSEIALYTLCGVLLALVLFFVGRYLYQKQKAMHNRNYLFFVIGKRIRLRRSEMNMIVDMGDELKIDNLLLFYTKESLWDNHRMVLEESRKKNKCEALQKKIFGE